jgi:hypothetical protein
MRVHFPSTTFVRNIFHSDNYMQGEAHTSGYEAMWAGWSSGSKPPVRRNTSPSASGPAWITLPPWRWRWYVPPIHRLNFTGLHGVTPQKILTLPTHRHKNIKTDNTQRVSLETGADMHLCLHVKWPLLLSDAAENWNPGEILVKLSSVKFLKNPFNDPQVITCRGMGTHGKDMYVNLKCYRCVNPLGQYLL